MPLYLDVSESDRELTPEESRRAFERLFAGLAMRVSNQRIVDAMKPHAHKSARVDALVSPASSGERTGERS